MNKLKLGTSLNLFGSAYKVVALSRKGVTFVLTERKDNMASELVLSLTEVENIVLGGRCSVMEITY